MRFRVTSVGLECAVVVCCAPALLFPLQSPPLTLVAVALIAATLLAGMLTRRAWRVPTPLFWPAVGLCGMVAIGAAVSTFPDVSIPKLAGVALGALAARLLVLAPEPRAHLWRAVILYLVVGAGTIAAGAMGTMWLWGSKTAIAPLLLRIPMLIRGLPGSEMGVNPNALGGTTLFFIPLLCSLVVGLSRELRAPEPASERDPARAFRHRRSMRVGRAAAAVLLVGLTVVLLLSQSRTSWASALATIGLMGAVNLRLTRWGWVGIVALVISVAAGVVRPALKSETNAQHQDAPLSREAIWAIGLADVRRSPWVGIGLDVFRKTIKVPPRPPGPPADTDIAHVHNVFLQTALDVGLPGLVVYMALLVLAMTLCLRVHTQARFSAEQSLALGLFGNLVAVHLFGMTDAIVLGAKVGLFLWWTLGLVAVLHRGVTRATGSGAVWSVPANPSERSLRVDMSANQ